jgi:two-component system, chemotaxis family, sensor kinase CheA
MASKGQKQHISAVAGSTASSSLLKWMEISPDPLIVVDQAGKILSVNSLAEALFAYTREELIGQPLEMLLPKHVRDLHATHLKHFFTAPRTRSMGAGLQLSGIRKDGTEFPVDISLIPILLDGTLSVIGTVRDMTEQKHLMDKLAISTQERAQRDELKRMNRELGQQRDALAALNTALEKANLARSQFLATMSHELRTPLASIVGFSEMLLDEAKQAGWNRVQQENLERILNNSEHLLDLINNVLDLSKIEAGRMVVSYKQVNVRELLGSLTQEIQSLARTRNLFLKTEVEEGIDCLETAPVQLRQILLNLLANALKFTRQGGVTLSATRVFLTDQQTEGVAFSVKDTGIGISPDTQKHIYEAFYQVDGSYTRKFGGVGLGLSIVYQLTMLLHGTVEVKSAPEQGSTFTISLPIKIAHQTMEPQIPRLHPMQQLQPLQALVQREAVSVGQHIILAVDDDPDFILIIRAALENTTYMVVGECDPHNTLKRVREIQPNAILLDVMMPGLNGWQLLHQLKDDPATAPIPVIMVTVLSEEATGYVLGADDYLIKPFKKETLCTILQHLIEAKNNYSPEASSGPVVVSAGE